MHIGVNLITPDGKVKELTANIAPMLIPLPDSKDKMRCGAYEFNFGNGYRVVVSMAERQAK